MGPSLIERLKGFGPVVARFKERDDVGVYRLEVVNRLRGLLVAMQDIEGGDGETDLVGVLGSDLRVWSQRRQQPITLVDDDQGESPACDANQAAWFEKQEQC